MFAKLFARGIKFYKKHLQTNKINFQSKSLYLIPFLLTPKIILAGEQKENRLDLKIAVRGQYENKIRAFASIEKKFAVFANIKTQDNLTMSYYQFFDSLTPFAYSEIDTLPEVSHIKLI